MSLIPGQAEQRSAADVYSARCPSRAALALIADKWAVLVAGACAYAILTLAIFAQAVAGRPLFPM